MEKRRSVKQILNESVELEKSGMEAEAIYRGLEDDERDRVFKAMTYSAALKTSARIENPSKLFKLVKENSDDLNQAANLRFLEAVSAGLIYNKKSGEKLNIIQLFSKSCNAAVTHAWREIYSHPTAELMKKDESGKEFSVVDLQADPTIKRPPAPEKALLINETISEVLQNVGQTYRADALSILKLTVSGYSRSEIAKRLGCSEKRVTRIRAAIAEAAEEYEENALNGWADAAREVVEALRNLYEN